MALPSLSVKDEPENQTGLLRPDCGGEDVGKLLECFKHCIDCANLLRIAGFGPLGIGGLHSLGLALNMCQVGNKDRVLF